MILYDSGSVAVNGDHMEPWRTLRHADSTQSVCAIAIAEGTGTLIVDGWLDGFDRPFMAAIRSTSGVVRIPSPVRVRVRINDAVGLVAIVTLLTLDPAPDELQPST